MFKEGDKYIHFTKYGGINKGEVKSYGILKSYDLTNCVLVDKPHIVTTKGALLQLDGSDGRIYKIEREFTKDEVENMTKNLEKLSKIKQESILESQEFLSKNKHLFGDIAQG